MRSVCLSSFSLGLLYFFFLALLALVFTLFSLRRTAAIFFFSLGVLYPLLVSFALSNGENFVRLVLHLGKAGKTETMDITQRTVMHNQLADRN